LVNAVECWTEGLLGLRYIGGSSYINAADEVAVTGYTNAASITFTAGTPAGASCYRMFTTEYYITYPSKYVSVVSSPVYYSSNNVTCLNPGLANYTQLIYSTNLNYSSSYCGYVVKFFAIANITTSETVVIEYDSALFIKISILFSVGAFLFSIIL